MTAFSRTIALLVAALVLRSGAAHSQAENQAQKAREIIGDRILLDDGSVIEITVVRTRNAGLAETVIAMRDLSGRTLSVRNLEDDVWETARTTVSDGKTTVETLVLTGFLKDGRVPFEARIGGVTYRTLFDESVDSHPTRALQGAVSKLPARFLSSLIALNNLGNSNYVGIPPEAAFAVSILFEGLPTRRVQSESALSADDRQALLDAVRSQGR